MPEHLRESGRRVRAERVRLGERPDERLDLRIRVRVGDPPERLALSEVDVAGVDERRHDDAGDPGEDLVPVERGGEELARLGEQAEAVVGPLAVRDLHDHGAHADRLSRLRADRVVAREPVPVAARRDLADVGRLLVHKRDPGLEHAPVHRLEPVGEARHDLGERLAHVLCRREAVDRCQCVVHAYEAEVAVPEADADRRRDEESVEQSQRLARLGVEARVLDRDGDPPRRRPA